MNEHISLSDAQIEQGWRETFSTNNPYCPCDLKTFTKAARWAIRETNAAIAALGQGEAVFEIVEGPGAHRPRVAKQVSDLPPVGAKLYTHAPQPVVLDWQQRCLDLGFKYWRAPDAHGVECTHDQALALLRDLLGVEVDFAAAPTPEAQPQGEGEVCDKALWQAIDEALKRSCESGAFNNIDEVIPWMLDRAAKLGATQPQASEAGQGVALNYAVVHKFAVDHGIDYNTLAKLVRDSVVATHTQEGR